LNDGDGEEDNAPAAARTEQDGEAELRRDALMRACPVEPPLAGRVVRRTSVVRAAASLDGAEPHRHA
jgi:hypothetical protein